MTHHQATLEVINDAGGKGCRIVWTSDFLPAGPGLVIEALMTQGAAVMEANFAAVATPA